MPHEKWNQDDLKPLSEIFPNLPVYSRPWELPSAEDLDAVAEEENAREKTK